VMGGAHGGIPDIVEDGVTGLLVPHGNIERLGEALETILSNPTRAREMGAQGRDRLEKRFSFRQFQLNLIEILDNVLARQK
jgi:glycosyltransferase involved in cell wall biosynthesis